jgi:hypothetical protein
MRPNIRSGFDLNIDTLEQLFWIPDATTKYTLRSIGCRTALLNPSAPKVVKPAGELRLARN